MVGVLSYLGPVSRTIRLHPFPVVFVFLAATVLFVTFKKTELHSPITINILARFMGWVHEYSVSQASGSLGKQVSQAGGLRLGPLLSLKVLLLVLAPISI